MTKKICQRLDYKYPDETGWHPIPLKGDAVLRMDTKHAEAGHINENKVTASMVYDKNFPIIRYPQKFVILRVFTDSGAELIIGTKEYPARVEYSDDRIVAKLTFTQSQPHI